MLFALLFFISNMEWYICKIENLLLQCQNRLCTKQKNLKSGIGSRKIFHLFAFDKASTLCYYVVVVSITVYPFYNVGGVHYGKLNRNAQRCS